MEDNTIDSLLWAKEAEERERKRAEAERLRKVLSMEATGFSAPIDLQLCSLNIETSTKLKLDVPDDLTVGDLCRLISKRLGVASSKTRIRITYLLCDGGERKKISVDYDKILREYKHVFFPGAVLRWDISRSVDPLRYVHQNDMEVLSRKVRALAEERYARAERSRGKIQPTSIFRKNWYDSEE